MIARAPSTAAHPGTAHLGTAHPELVEGVEGVEGHDETPTESGCIFAAALIVVLALMLITPALLS